MRDPCSEGIGPMLAVCGQLCKQRMDQKLQQYGVTQAQAHVILYLIEAEGEGEVNQKALEKKFQIRASTVNGIVERLEEKGFLTRATGRRDNRCRCLTVTEKGRCLEQEMYRSFQETEAMMHRGFAEEETRQLHTLLGRMIANLKEGAADL